VVNQEPIEPRAVEPDEPERVEAAGPATAKRAIRPGTPFDLPVSASTLINMHRQGRVIE
jgi:hypothetical protein